ncbi:MAG TPA: phytanoyl-CoA dioxygenase family protein [Acidimicrobiales bacterium]|nr:phytanoyl-CoA dioxygenase family protein [Acidimicrobiales bacterium]
MATTIDSQSLPTLLGGFDEKARADLATYGYCLIAGALSPDEVEALRRRLDEQAAGEAAAGVATFDAGGANQRVWNLINKGEAFRRLVLHPLAGVAMDHLVGSPHLLSSITANIAAQGGQPMILHSDQGYVTMPQPPYAMVANIMWMLDDFTEDNGATRVVPGSHQLGAAFLAPGSDEAATAVPATGPAGTALIFDGRLLHGTGANTTAEPRRGILTYFCRTYVRQQENFTLSIRDDVLAAASEELKDLLGFRCQNTLGGVEGPRVGSLVGRPADPVGELSG